MAELPAGTLVEDVNKMPVYKQYVAAFIQFTFVACQMNMGLDGSETWKFSELLYQLKFKLEGSQQLQGMSEKLHHFQDNHF